jgi:hypothetical protein
VAVDQKQISPNGDIALLHLAQAVGAGPIALGSADPAAGTTNQLYGWGRTTPTGQPATSLKVADRPVRRRVRRPGDPERRDQRLRVEG